MKLLLLFTFLLLPISVQAKDFDIEDDCKNSLSNNIKDNALEKIEDALEDKCKDKEKESNEKYNDCLHQVLDRFHDNDIIRSGEKNDLIKCFDKKDDKKHDDKDKENDGGGQGGIASEALYVTKIDQLDFDFIDDDKARKELIKDLEKCEDKDKKRVMNCARNVVHHNEEDLTYNWEERILDLIRASSIGEDPWDDGDNDKDKDDKEDGGIATDEADVTTIADLDFSFIKDEKLREEVVEDLEKCLEDKEGDSYDFHECVGEVVRHDYEEDLKYNEMVQILDLISASSIGDERRYLRGSKHI